MIATARAPNDGTKWPSAAALVLLGWVTGLRAVLHGALLALAVGALLPFAVLIAATLVWSKAVQR